jgi:hypothetical protein
MALRLPIKEALQLLGYLNRLPPLVFPIQRLEALELPRPLAAPLRYIPVLEARPTSRLDDQINKRGCYGWNAQPQGPHVCPVNASLIRKNLVGYH